MKKKKSLLRALIQKLFLKLILKLFPKKFLSYKNKIKLIMNKSGYFFRLYLACTYLRFRYPLYFRMPSTQLYAIGTAIKFLKILKPQNIDFFLMDGSLLGAVRQGSFAGRPSDIDLGIKEDQLPKLLNAIPLLMKSGARFIRTRPHNKIERLQILFSCMLVDIGIYRKQKKKGKVMWTNFGGERKNDYLIHVQKLIHSQERHLPQNENLTKNRFAISLDHLIPIEVYGRMFMAPPNPEVYLKKKYGKNWRTPDKKQFFWNKSEFKKNYNYF
jgi:hypothetical protein